MAAAVPTHAPTRERDRGRDARRPADIPAKGWWDIFMRVKQQLDEDNVGIVAAGLALYALLALFPALAASVSLFGLFASPAQLSEQLNTFAGLLPQQTLEVVRQQMQDLASKGDHALSFGLIGGLLLALWSARKGMVALMSAINVAYNEKEHRGFVRRLLVSLAFTVGAVIGFLIAILLGVALPLALHVLPLGAAAGGVLLAARWALLWAFAVIGLAITYRFAPSRRHAQWKWISWGSAIAATLWIVGSAIFGLYVQYSDSYGKTYGTLGGAVILLMWLYLSGYAVLLGAEINSEMERQTARDTTEGSPKPLGDRGAYSADTVGPSHR